MPLAAGSVVYLVVSQTPTYNVSAARAPFPFPSLAGQFGGGGGGTYVLLGDLNTPLLVACALDCNP